MKVRLWKNKLVISGIEDKHRNGLNSLPGFKKWVGPHLFCENIGANLDHLYHLFSGVMELTNEVSKLFEQREKDGEDCLLGTFEKDNFELPEDDDFEFKTKPYEHQRKAFYLNRDKKEYALLMDQGTGKTKVIIDTAKYLYDKGEINCCVVIAPNNVHRNWTEREIPIHCPGEFKAAFFSNKMNKKQQAELHKACSYDGLKFISYNVEGFVSSKAKEHIAKVIKGNNCLLVIDESTRIKNPSAKRTKFILKAAPYARYRRILSGTPVTKGVENLFTQFKFLSDRILGFSSFYTFRNRYCVLGGFENKQIIAYKNVDELKEKIGGFSYRVLKSQCLDLPPKVYKRWTFDLEPKQRKIYDELRKEYMTELNGVEVSVALGIVRAMRLHQIACGWFAADEEWDELQQFAKNPRLEILDEVLAECEDSPGKTIIWAKFKKDITEITARLGKRAVYYHGDISNDDKAEAIDRFQNDPEVEFFVGNPKSGGIGITLTAADNVIYYSYDEDLEIMLQSEDRSHRIDEERNKGRKAIVYHHIEARKTVDGKIIRSLKDKKSISDMITDDPACLFID